MRRIAFRDIADAKAKRLLTRWGRPVDISPAQALLAMVHEAAGNVAFLGGQIDAMMEPEEPPEPEEGSSGEGFLAEVRDFVNAKDTKVGLFDQKTSVMPRTVAGLFGPIVAATSDGSQFQVQEEQRAILRLYGEWTDRLVKYSKAAIDAGVAKAQVELARKQAEMIVFMFKAVLADLQLSEEKIKLAQTLLATQMRKLATTIIDGKATEVNLLTGPTVRSRAMNIDQDRGGSR